MDFFRHENRASMFFDIAYCQYDIGLGTPIPTNGDYSHWVTLSPTNASLKDLGSVEWYGVTQEGSSNCTYHEQNLNGNGAQVNNVCTPENGSGEMVVGLRSITGRIATVELEVYNWRNGSGCN